jgi:hypothetical protein
MGYGQIIPQNDPVYLSDILQKIINKDNLETLYDQVNWENNDVSWENFLKEAVSTIIPKRDINL